jgi:hypothetical protein
MNRDGWLTQLLWRLTVVIAGSWYANPSGENLQALEIGVTPQDWKNTAGKANQNCDQS